MIRHGAPRPLALAALVLFPLVVIWGLSDVPGGADPDYGEVPCPTGLGCYPSPSPTTAAPATEPAPPEPLAPQGAIATRRTGFLWSDVPRIGEYRLTVEDDAGHVVHAGSYAPADVCVRGRCLAPESPALPAAAYRWRVQALGAEGGEWASAPMAFTVGDGPASRIVYHSQTTGHLRVWFLDGTAKVGEAPLAGPTQWDAVVVGAGDFNRDGRSDIVWREHLGRRAVVTWEMYDLAPLAGPSFPQLDAQSLARGVADFNRDGTPDLLLHALQTQVAAIQYMNGAIVTDIGLLPGHPATDPPDPAADLEWNLVGAGDFDRDGRPDVLWRNPATGQTTVWFMNGHSKIGEADLPRFPRGLWHVRGAADVDHDGDADILLWDPSDGTTCLWVVEPRSGGGLAVGDGAPGGPTTFHGVPLPRVLGKDAELGWRVVGFLPADVPVPAPLMVNGSASSLTVDPGAVVSVDVRGGPGLGLDWVGKFAAAAANTVGFSDWKYLDGTQDPPAVGHTSARLRFVMPPAAGDYNFRFFRNDGRELLATSPTVTVRNLAKLLVNGASAPIAVPPATEVTVAVSGGPAFARDWVGRHVASDADTLFRDWRYLSDTTAPPPAAQTAGTLHFLMPVQPGDYNFRFFKDDGYTLLATSPIVTVVAPIVTVNGHSTTVTVAPGASVSVGVSGGPGFPLDWVGGFAFDAPDLSPLPNGWQYLDGSQERPPRGQRAATLRFTMPTAPGGYHFRLFHNDTRERLAISPLVIVAAPAP